MNTKCFDLTPLSDIEMYGGDTTPWEIVLMRDGNTHLGFDLGSDCSATLTLLPAMYTSGNSISASPPSPLLSKTGIMKEDSSGGTLVQFSFTETDTKHLRGKFTYQVEVRYTGNVRIGQGTVYIKQNINR